MKKKVGKVSFVAFVVLGIGIGFAILVGPPILNAGTRTFWGTIVQQGTEPNPSNPAWLYDNWYCIGEESNCSITRVI